MRRFLLLMALLAMGLTSSCKFLNDDPAEGMSITLDLQELQTQMGVSNLAPGNNLDSAVRALLIGTMLVTERETPWNVGDVNTADLYELFGLDYYDSLTHFYLLELPYDSSEITLVVPPNASGHWQVVAIGLTSVPGEIKNIGRYGDTSPKYFGFSEGFLTQDLAANASITVKMQRACRVTPTPEGCAIFGPTLLSDPVVTASLEVVGFKVNGQDFYPLSVSLPQTVRDATQAGNAVTGLINVRGEMTSSVDQVDSLSILVTHRTSPTEVQACKDLETEPDPTGNLHLIHCDVQEYRVNY